IDSPLGRLHDSKVTSSGDTGVYLYQPGNNSVVDSTESGNNGGYGIYVAGSTGTASIGNPDLSLGRGNPVHDNARYGIYAPGSIHVDGNTVSGSVGVNNIGIELVNGATASRNVVHDNTLGIDAYNGAVISQNRIYHNADAGIQAGYNSTL